MSRRRFAVAAPGAMTAAAALSLCHAMAHAQAPSPASPAAPSRTPASPTPPTAEKTFTLNGVVFDGANLARAGDLAKTWKALKGRQVSLKDLSRIARAVEARYAKRGYPFTAVVVPPQSLDGGVVHLKVFEGRISSLVVLGSDTTARRQASAMFEPLKGRSPLALGALDQATLVARDVPGLQTTPQLGPGAEAGSMELVVKAARTPISGSIDVTNTYSKALGFWAVSAQGSYAGEAPYGEEWTGQFLVDAAFERQGTIHVGYSRGLNAEGTAVSLGVTDGRSWPTGSFADLSIASKVWNVRAQVQTPLYLRPTDSVRLTGALEWTDQDTDVFSASSLSEDRIGVFSLELDGTHTTKLTQIGWTLELRQGIKLPDTSRRTDADLSRPGGDPLATVYKGSIAVEQTLPWGFRAAARLQTQATSTPLLVPDQFSFGNLTVVRGYEPSVLLGDKAVADTWELHTPRAILPRSFRVSGFVFADNGVLWTLGPQKSEKWASSRGVGFVFELPYGVQAQVTYADANHITGVLHHNDQALFVLHAPLDTGLLDTPMQAGSTFLSQVFNAAGKPSR